MGRTAYASTYTVEECLSISISDLKRLEFFDGGIRASSLKCGRNKFVVIVDPENAFVRFIYSTKRPNRETIDNDYKVQLRASRPNYGGLRYWFVCPLGGCIAGKVGVLYLPPFSYSFGCRKCYGLQYRSTRESKNPWYTLEKAMVRLYNDEATLEDYKLIDHFFKNDGPGKK